MRTCEAAAIVAAHVEALEINAELNDLCRVPGPVQPAQPARVPSAMSADHRREKANVGHV